MNHAYNVLSIHHLTLFMLETNETLIPKISALFEVSQLELAKFIRTHEKNFVLTIPRVSLSPEGRGLALSVIDDPNHAQTRLIVALLKKMSEIDEQKVTTVTRLEDSYYKALEELTKATDKANDYKLRLDHANDQKASLSYQMQQAQRAHEIQINDLKSAYEETLKDLKNAREHAERLNADIDEMRMQVYTEIQLCKHDYARDITTLYTGLTAIIKATEAMLISLDREHIDTQLIHVTLTMARETIRKYDSDQIPF